MKKALYILLAIVALAAIAYFIKQKYSLNPPIKLKDLHSDTLVLRTSKLKIADGMKIEIFARDVNNARSMCLSPNNTLYVGNRDGDKVYALRDEDGDNVAEKKYIIHQGGKMPNGVAFRDGDLYIAEVNKIIKYEDIESKLANPGKPVVVYDKYPSDEWHGWKYIAFGPDGKLYVPVGAPCNVCISKDKVYNSITRMNADGSNMEVVHTGIRNSVGFTWL
jgi:glucose/arabinose dehydrogenase